MPLIQLQTKIAAPIEVCFDLSRSIEFHEKSTPVNSHEQAIAGKTSGLIGLGEEVTWRAKHLGLWRKMSVRITSFDPPHFFTDSMVTGPFKRFDHRHEFQFLNGHTMMHDTFDYDAPFGMIGQLADVIFLKNYMTCLLAERNKQIRNAAESGGWKIYLTGN